MKRTLRPRAPGQYVSQQEWHLEAQQEDDFILGRRYNVLEKFHREEYMQDHGFVTELDGKDFTMKYVQENGIVQPIVFRKTTDLGMRMPSGELTVAEIKKLVGSRRKVDVIDTLTQDSSSMSLGQWSKYYQSLPRKRILNIISLEFSCTKLDPLVQAPTVVRELDWVEQVWPRELKNLQTNPTNDLNKMMYPKVQKYCLMSVAGCYTDFHIDFGGTSVWYHVLRGEKQFLLIPPSRDSYSLFQHWQMSGEQEGLFLAELVGKAQLVHLHAGDTFIMPSGWIHAVYTPSDSIVFGGNFLHSFNIAQQLAVAELEQETKVPPKQRYPFYGSIHWYVVQRYTEALSWLRGAGNAAEGVGAEDGEAKGTLQSSGQWLKHISMKRVCTVSSKGKMESSKKQSDEVSAPSDAAFGSAPVHSAVQDSTRAFQEAQDNASALQDSSTASVLSSTDDQDISRALQDNSTSNQDTLMETSVQDTSACLQDNQTMQDSQTVLQDSIVTRALETDSTVCTADTNQSDLSCTAAKKPHFSSHERGGLLLLVHKMKNALFEKDVPSSLPSPQDVILELEELLQSSLSDQVCSLEPSGMGVVSSRHTHSKTATPSQAGARKRNSAMVCQESDCMTKRGRTAGVAAERVTMAQCNRDSPEVEKLPASVTDTTSDTGISARLLTPITSHTLSFQPILSTATLTPLMATPTSTATPTCVAPRPALGDVSSGPAPSTSAVTLVSPLTDCQTQGQSLQATLGLGWVYTSPLSALPAGVLGHEFAEVSVIRMPNPAFSS